MSLYTHPCLFCGDNHRQRTVEHVVQCGFGSNWTLPKDVCSECNTNCFSSLDKQLIDFAHKSIYPHHHDVLSQRTLLQEGHCVYYDETSGLWLSVRLDNNACPIILPQLIDVNENTLAISLDPKINSNWEFQIDQIKQELSNPSDLSLKELIFSRRDTSLPPVQPAVIRSGRNKYLIRAATQEEITKLREQILGGQLLLKMNIQTEPQRQTQQQIKVQGSFSVNIGDIHRALAKSAVNIACACLGPDRAREPALNHIKSFVLGQIPYKEKAFVEDYWGGVEGQDINVLARQFGKPGNHTILLTPMVIGVPAVTFLLYGKPFAVVSTNGRS